MDHALPVGLVTLDTAHMKKHCFSKVMACNAAGYAELRLVRTSSSDHHGRDDAFKGRQMGFGSDKIRLPVRPMLVVFSPALHCSTSEVEPRSCTCAFEDSHWKFWKMLEKALSCTAHILQHFSTICICISITFRSPDKAVLNTPVLQYLVKRQGADYTDYGLVDAKAVKRQRLQGSQTGPICLDLVAEYEEFVRRFKQSVHNHKDGSALDLGAAPVNARPMSSSTCLCSQLLS